jgi:hypothetical protein
MSTNIKRKNGEKVKSKFGKKKAKKEIVIEKDDNDDSDDNNEELSNDDDDQNSEGKQDGFADMMNKILNQNLGNKKVPVLAKRKTSIMKEIDGDVDEKERVRNQRLKRKEEKEKQLDIPDHTTLDFERQLRKLATRGVVALFNAISKSKREEIEVQNGDKKDDTENIKKSKPSLKQITQENFMEMLKDTSNRKDSKSKIEEHYSDSDDEEKLKTDVGAKGWSALQDDYLLDRKLALKDWDKDDSSDDGEDDSEASDDERGGRGSKVSIIYFYLFLFIVVL